MNHIKIKKRLTKRKRRTAWNKGLTKDTDDRVKRNGESLKGNVTFKGRKHSLKTKEQIKESMLKAHKENRAHKWTRKEPSYAEKTFCNFLEQQGYVKDIDFIMEFPFFPYKVDFYFPKYNFVIEVDGKQHTKYEEMRKRDKMKDVFLKSKNITLLRINWRDLFHNAKDTFESVLNILNNLDDCKLKIENFTKKQIKRLKLLDQKQEAKNC
jgi:very-short-patch-repair endonuclease